MNAEEAAAFQIRVRQQKRKKVRHRASKPRRTVNVLTVDAEQVAPNQPLPKPPTLTLPRELATFNHPLDAHERRMWHEESYAKKYEASASKRAQGRVEQRKLDGTKWTTHWALESVMQGCSGRQIMRFLSPVLAPARSLTFASLTQDQAAFFPYPECEGLGALDGVFATVGGDMVSYMNTASDTRADGWRQIELWRLRDHNSTQSGAFTASRNGQRILSNKLACAQLSALGAAQKVSSVGAPRLVSATLTSSITERRTAHVRLVGQNYHLPVHASARCGWEARPHPCVHRRARRAQRSITRRFDLRSHHLQPHTSTSYNLSSTGERLR